MKPMNEVQPLHLREFMERSDGWGRTQGRVVYQLLLEFVERSPGALVFRVSLKDVHRIDISFASETIVELARRYRRYKGFCVVDLTDKDVIENLDAAAQKKEQPILLWGKKSADVIGPTPSEGIREAFQFAMARGQSRATEFATEKGISVANASMKFKQLWERGFLLRRESNADTGGIEFLYERIG